MSDAEYYAQRSANPSKPNLGRVLVQENAMTRMGGLCLIRRRLNHHEKAAEWFKNAYEQLYGGISPAIDMAKVRVDTSIMAHDNGAVIKLDNGHEMRRLIVGTGQGEHFTPPLLSKAETDRIVACVVLCIPCSENAGPRGSGKLTGRALEREVDALLDALDHLAELRGWKMRGRAA